MWSWWLGSHHPPWMGTSSWVQSWSQAWCRFDSHLCPYPCGSPSKESACNAGDLGSISVLGRSPGEGKGYPLQYSGLENSMDCIVYGVSKSWTRLSDLHVTSSRQQNLKWKRCVLNSYLLGLFDLYWFWSQQFTFELQLAVLWKQFSTFGKDHNVVADSRFANNGGGHNPIGLIGCRPCCPISSFHRLNRI